MDIIALVTQREFLIAALAAISATAAVFTFGSSLLVKQELKGRIQRVALEREKMRAQEMSRLRGSSAAVADRSSIRRDDNTKAYMRKAVDRFDLRKAFQDENTLDQLSMAGLRGPAELTKYLFVRFTTPVAVLLFAIFYLVVVAPGDRPMYLSLAYSVAIGVVGAYLPVLLLKNKIQKRQASIRRAWPDVLDLMLLCVEAGMSMEHAIKRVAKEIGGQSPQLAEELTLTNAELSFLEDRSRAYENLGRRTGLDNVRAVMTALIQADRYGTSVGQALRVMAEEGREARMMEAEKKAAALPPKLTVPLILFLLPVLFIVVLSPAMIKVFTGSVASTVGGG
ncbi:MULTISPECIES: type II secretion system F family protein [unclassified Devosia]|uniref:type II secretion system F family protein n=1 Tax=unclassified Devosia TaxID=196773 RepID=UPI00145E37A1|nr:type II secretion system F family protein [Devosia sp. MC521]MBJ6988793.1 type II secretion system F family protein [Devosia sp. MC521]MBK1796272.1 type II secretion system F family protein [Devosia sp. WQ 349K1]QMW63072.1 type II secretion system F family protein [Devosia sp. MC521]